VCTECNAGQFQDSVGGSECTMCTEGQHQSTAGSSSCSACPEGKYNTNQGQSACRICEAGRYQTVSSGSSCLLCSGGLFSTTTGRSTTCTTAAHDDADECTAGYFSLDGATSCSVCAAGRFQAGARQTNCNDCAAGEWALRVVSKVHILEPYNAWLALTCCLRLSPLVLVLHQAATSPIPSKQAALIAPQASFLTQRAAPQYASTTAR
jgi:hypothetical protein